MYTYMDIYTTDRYVCIYKSITTSSTTFHKSAQLLELNIEIKTER